MSVKSNLMTTTTITTPNVGTASLGSSSILASSTAFVNNFVNNLNMVLNQILTYTLTGIKTFANDLTIGGFTNSAGNPSIGTVNAGTIKLCPSSSGALTLNTLAQPLQPITSTSWSKPLIIALPQDTATPHTKIVSGIIPQIDTTNRTVSYPIAFTVGCVPRVFAVSTSTTPQTIAVFNVTNSSFQCKVVSGTVTGSYFALGF